jgi:hypothetical protein
MSEKSKPKIYVFCNSCQHKWHGGIAMAEDGNVLAQHLSSNHTFVQMDLGVISGSHWRTQHEKYDEHYPDGWEIVYLEGAEEITNHHGLQEAFRLNQLLAAEAEQNR